MGLWAKGGGIFTLSFNAEAADNVELCNMQPSAG